MIRSVGIRDRRYNDRKDYDRRAVRQMFAVGDWVLRYYSPAKKC